MKSGSTSPPLVALCLLALTACSQASRPNVVVVCIDTVRADHTSLYGYERQTTPNFERIAERGLVLGRHFANASWTKPSVASIITGLHPSAHGSRVGQFSTKKDKPQFVEMLSQQHQTMAEVFREEGYQTVAHVTNYNMLGRFGYDQGYDTYKFVGGATGDNRVNGSDREAVEFALEALENAEGPLFAWVHMMSVHQYIAPEPYRRFTADPENRTPIDRDATAHGRVRNYEILEDAVADYDNSILYTDALVGELYGTLQSHFPNTILLVISDHGEEFYDHGGFEHGSTLYNEMLLVPALLVGPGVPVGRVDGITDSLDLLPTLYDLALGDIEPGLFAGQSVVRGGSPTTGKGSSFAEQHHRGPYQRYAVVEEAGTKLIRSERKKNGAVFFELFDDGFEIEGRDTSKSAPGEVQRLEADIESLRDGAEAHYQTFVGETETTELRPEDLESLKAIGYVE